MAASSTSRNIAWARSSRSRWGNLPRRVLAKASSLAAIRRARTVNPLYLIGAGFAQVLAQRRGPVHETAQILSRRPFPAGARLPKSATWLLQLMSVEGGRGSSLWRSKMMFNFVGHGRGPLSVLIAVSVLIACGCSHKSARDYIKAGDQAMHDNQV